LIQTVQTSPKIKKDQHNHERQKLTEAILPSKLDTRTDFVDTKTDFLEAASLSSRL
jgi:hypothetical protein